MAPAFIFVGLVGAGCLLLAYWLAFDADEKPESYDPSSPFEADFYAKEAAPWSSP